MAEFQIAALQRQARCFVHPILIGSDADMAVNAIVAWELAYEGVERARSRSQPETS
jgi:hypothetical protein